MLGLNDLDIDGEWLVERQALWVVPAALKEAQSGDPECEELSFTQPLFSDPATQDVYIFKLEDCALKALQQVYSYNMILCSLKL